MATMEQGTAEEAEQSVGSVRGRHIKKRALKNKSLSVSFDEKDLQEFVTGFHKRKKKRRKEAQKQLQEAERRKRIEDRKKRKLEREFAIHGGVPPESGAESYEHVEDEDQDDEEDTESNGPNAPVSGTTMYDNGDVQVTVTTSEISHEQEFPALRPPPAAPELPHEITINRGSIPVSKKKPFKKAVKRKSRAKPQNKRDKKKGKVKNKKH